MSECQEHFFFVLKLGVINFAVGRLEFCEVGVLGGNIKLRC